MKEFFGRLAIVLVGIVICLGGAWIYLRGKGLSASVPDPLNHPFRAHVEKNKPAVVAYQGSSLLAPPNSMEAFEAAAKLSEKVILWMDVRPTMDRELVALESADLSHTTEKQAWLQLSNWKDIESLDAGFTFSTDGSTFPFRGKGLRIQKMSEVLAKFPSHFFVLNFRDYKEGLAEKIIKEIDDAKAGDRVLIASPEDGILRDLRELKAMWIFGTSQAQVTRMYMLQEFGLEAAVKVRGDVFVAPVAQGAERFRLTDQLMRELKRRKLLVLAPQNEKLAEGPDGIVTREPEKLIAPRAE